MSEQALQVLVQGNNAFAFDLYHRITQGSQDNLIYSPWLFPFDQSTTRDMPFALLDGSQVEVAMMHLNSARVPYLRGEDFQVAWLPYTGQQVDMLVILPGEGQFESVQAELSSAFLDQLRSQATLHDVTLAMPRAELTLDRPFIFAMLERDTGTHLFLGRVLNPEA